MAQSIGFSRRAAWAQPPPISDLMSRALANPRVISLAAGFVDPHTLPAEAVRQTMAGLFADPRVYQAALQYGSTPGYDELRQLILEQLRVEDFAGGACEVELDQVVITAGSNQLLHLIAETLLDPGDIVLCAAPTYFVFLGTLENVGARGIGIETDEHGMIPAALTAALDRLRAAGEGDRIKAVYLVSYFDNPRGLTTPASRLEELLAITQSASRRFPIRLIADEAYRLLQYEGSVPRSARAMDERGETVIVAGTFSKSFSPGIRVGWGILPRDLVEPVCRQKGNVDFGSPNFTQHLMAQVLREELLAPHVERLRAEYRRKLKATLAAAERFLAPCGVRWRAPAGGLYLWLELPEGVDAGLGGPLFQAALAEQVLYVPGDLCFPREGAPPRHETIRLSFGVQPVENIQRGVEALGNAIRHCQRD